MPSAQLSQLYGRHTEAGESVHRITADIIVGVVMERPSAKAQDCGCGSKEPIGFHPAPACRC